MPDWRASTLIPNDLQKIQCKLKSCKSYHHPANKSEWNVFVNLSEGWEPLLKLNYRHSTRLRLLKKSSPFAHSLMEMHHASGTNAIVLFLHPATKNGNHVNSNTRQLTSVWFTYIYILYMINIKEMHMKAKNCIPKRASLVIWCRPFPPPFTKQIIVDCRQLW